MPFLAYQLLPFVFILGFCITIHEIGHFIFAKIFGIPVEKFSIGYGPPILRKKIGETDFRIAYFPLGGYVKMAGEEEGVIAKNENLPGTGDSPEADTSRPQGLSPSPPGFYEAPVYKRILVVFSGPFFNLISAFFVLFGMFLFYGIPVTPYMNILVDENSYYSSRGMETGDSIIAANGSSIDTWEDLWMIAAENKGEVTLTMIRDTTIIEIDAVLSEDSSGLRPLVPPILGSVKKKGPADRAQMEKGDIIVAINDMNVSNWYDMVNIIHNSPGESLQIMWKHLGEVKMATVVPQATFDPFSNDTIGQIGVFIPQTRKHLPVKSLSILAFQEAAARVILILDIFYRLLTREVSARQLGGPIAIFRLSAESARWGFEYLLQLLILISINLGLINLFPIPALDGGHIVIALFEAIRRKRLSKRSRMIVQQIGYAIILILIIFVTFNDITR